MGWMALFCALPMWITSINWVRRKYYSLFKLAHWLFIGVLVFGVMHVRACIHSISSGLAVFRYCLPPFSPRRCCLPRTIPANQLDCATWQYLLLLE